MFNMSYPIANSVLDLFKHQQRQVADITLYGTNDTIHLTEQDILQGGLTIDRYCVSGSRIEIGSAIASELLLTLDNNDGRFNDIVFEGAELFVKIGIKKWEARKWEKAVIHYIPMGYFTVDNSPRKLSSISLSALDRMVMFDRECKPTDISFPIDISTLLVKICTKCNVSLATDSSQLTNSQYIVQNFPEGETITYRQILMWIAEITGTCAFIDWDGKLRLEWYSEESSVTLSPDVRYSSDINDKTVKITGVQAKIDDDTIYLQGTSEYAFNIESNGLLQKNIEIVVTALYEKLKNFSYTPYSCVVKPFVHLYPLDRVFFEDKKGNKVSSIVTNTTFTMNANLQLSGQGETETSDGYAKANPMTKQESTIINSVKKIINTQVTSRQQALLNLNETIVNSLGLYRSEEVQNDGSVIYYYHDKANKAESSVIYTFRAGGFAWTDNWNNGNPVWQNGIDKSGNAVLKILSANQINADHIEAGSITADRLSVEFTQTLVTGDELSENTETLRQEFMAADGVLKSEINTTTTEKLKEYSTTAEMNSAISQNAESINLSVSKRITETRSYADTKAQDAEDNAKSDTTEKLKEYSTTAEMNSAIDIVKDRISLIVTETDNGNVINSASIITAINNDESVITLNANKINLTAYPKKSDISLDVTNSGTNSSLSLKCGDETIDTATIKITGVVKFSDLSSKGNTTINGGNITTGTISASRIDTDNLSCTKLYAKGYSDKYSMRLNGNWGDFGMFTPSAADDASANGSDCVWGVYQSDMATGAVNFYVYGKNFAGYNKNSQCYFAKGAWNFSGCTSIEWGNNAPIAIFG